MAFVTFKSGAVARVTVNTDQVRFVREHANVCSLVFDVKFDGKEHVISVEGSLDTVTKVLRGDS